MARSRNLKPSFFLNEELAALGMEAQLLFAGLWTLADRSGRLEDRPMRIKASIFPYYDLSIETILNSLATAKDPFIQRYEANGARYIQIVKFDKHQHPHVKEPDSTIPAPDEHGAEPVPKRPHASNCNPITVTLNDAQPVPAGAFNQIWAKYPRRKGRKAAERHFKASVKTMKDWLDIQNALDNYISEIRRDRIEAQFVKHGSTWFNNWQDDVSYKGVEMPKPPAPKPKPPEPPPRENTHEELLEMHAQTLAVLKRCPSGPTCKLCAEISKGKKVVEDAVKAIAKGAKGIQHVR